MFHDALLVRTANGYETTPKGERLLQELSTMLPRLDRLLSGADFDPDQEQATFRIAGTDNAFAVLSPTLCRQVLPWPSNVTIQMRPWHDAIFEDLERGRLDLTLNADDGHMPEHLQRELLYEDEFVCVVSADSRFTRAITLKEYLKAHHIGVGILAGRQTIPEQRLSALGYQRSCPIEVPYFSTAFRSVVGTPLIATVPRRMAMTEPPDARIRVVDAPVEMGRFRYLMAWHPRVETDAAHVWLRRQIRLAGGSLTNSAVRQRPRRAASRTPAGRRRT